MKKSYKLMALAILAGLAFTTTSCTKCRTCDLVDSNGTIQSSNQVCGDKDQMNQLKTDCESFADLDPSIDCNCHLGFSF